MKVIPPELQFRLGLTLGLSLAKPDAWQNNSLLFFKYLIPQKCLRNGSVIKTNKIMSLLQPLWPGGLAKKPKLSKSPNALNQVFKSGWNVLDFSNIDFKKVFNQKFWNLFKGYTILAPQSVVSPKMSTSALPMTLLFFFAESFSTQNWIEFNLVLKKIMRF